MSLADRNDSGLGSQNSGHEILSTDVANGRDAESAIVEVCLSETSVGGARRQVFQVIINLENALRLDLLDVGDGETVGAVNRNAEVVVVLQDVPLDVALVVELVVDVRVNHGELSHRDRARLNEKWQHGQIGVHFLHFFAESNQGSGVH